MAIGSAAACSYTYLVRGKRKKGFKLRKPQHSKVGSKLSQPKLVAIDSLTDQPKLFV
jgi:hypothetical protein